MTTKIDRTIIIPEEYFAERLDQALAKLLPEFSRTQIKDWIDHGFVLMNGQTVKGKVKLKGNETIHIQAEIKITQTSLPQAIPLPIVYEDESLIIINKPQGLVVHPGAGNKDNTLLNALLHHAPQLANLPRAGILHRIDKNTTGLLVIAKTAAALRHLSQQLKNKSLQREYIAIVYGILISGGTVDAPIGRHHFKRKEMAITETGKESITHYRILEKFRAHTALTVKLETGRTHQIRVHMAHIRHPIIGDPIYGGRVQLTKGMTPELIAALRKFKRQALHAFALGLIHPETEETMRFEAPIPEDMRLLLQLLKEDTRKKKT